MVAVAQHKQQYDQKNDATDDLTQKMRNRRLPFVFEIEIPDVAINQRDNQRCAQQDRCRAHILAPLRMDSVNHDCGVEREDQTKESKQKTQPHTGATF